MDAKRTADKYVERGGYAKGERAARWSEDLLAAVSFIGWHDADAMVGGYRSREAFEALCRLLNLEPHEMRKIIGTDKSNA